MTTFDNGADRPHPARHEARTTRPRARRLLPAVVAAALLLSACGGDDDAELGAGEDLTSSTTAAPDESGDSSEAPDDGGDAEEGDDGAAKASDGECPLTTSEVGDHTGSDGWTGGEGVEVGGGVFGCSFLSADQASMVTITTVRGQIAAQAFDGARQEASNDGENEEVAVSGIGNEAYLYDQGTGLLAAVALGDERMAQVITSGDVTTDAAKELLATVMERL